MTVVEYAHLEFVHPPETRSINDTLVQYGVIGASPEKPQVGFTFQFLESFRQLHRVCPRLSLSATAVALLHIHKVCIISSLDQLI
jgi:hypothetical protein